MIILIFFIAHWYISLFFQTFFNHRYAAHRMFTMSPFWEKVFFVGSWIGMGSSYLSPKSYGIMHRMHHAFADTEKDPHSPKYSKGLFDMMWKTRGRFNDIWEENYPIEERFTKNLPEWEWFDRFAMSYPSRLFWVAVYAAFYIAFASSWWLLLLLPLTIIISPVHGAVINWFAHKFGYRNFEVADTSMNIMPVDILMLGEGFHNNHHKHGSRPNFGYRWFEFDPVYPFIRLFDLLGIIRLKGQKANKAEFSIRLSKTEIQRIQAAFNKLSLPSFDPSKFRPEEKLKDLLRSWDSITKKDWKENVNLNYQKALQTRKEIQLFLENAGKSVREELEKKVAPLDRLFEEQKLKWQLAR